MQTVINDPITLLQQVVKQQSAEGFTYEGTVLNICTQAKVSFRNNPNDPNGPFTTVSPSNGSGSIGNIPFLEGETTDGPNADTATVFATFWIEKVKHPVRPHFIQLQYAQMVLLNFPIFTALFEPVAPNPATLINIGWPHVSVATLTKSFN
jgi:hypothetical protein